MVWEWAADNTGLNAAMSNGAVNAIANFNYVMQPDGSVIDGTSGSNTVSNLVNYADSHNVNTYATVTNWDNTLGNFNATTLSTVLNSSSLRATLEQNLVNTAEKDGYTGIDLDMEVLKPTDQAVFTDFVDELSNQLHAADKKLSVTIPAESSAESWYSGYNLSAIGQAADVVPVMTYDYHWFGGTPGAIAPLPWVEQVIRYTTQSIPTSKVLLGIGAYGYDWYTGGTNANSLTLSQIDNVIQTNQLSPTWDSTDSVPELVYTDANNVTHTIFYENQQSIRLKMGLVSKYGLNGVAIWRAGSEDPTFWNAVNTK